MRALIRLRKIVGYLATSAVYVAIIGTGLFVLHFAPVVVGSVQNIQLEPRFRQGVWVTLSRWGKETRAYIPCALLPSIADGEWLGVRGSWAQAGGESVLLANAAEPVPGFLVLPARLRRAIAPHLTRTVVAIAGVVLINIGILALWLTSTFGTAWVISAAAWLIAFVCFPQTPALDVAVGAALFGLLLGGFTGSGSKLPQQVTATVLALIIGAPMAHMLHWPVPVARAAAILAILGGTDAVVWFIGAVFLAWGVGATAPPYSYGVFALSGVLYYARVRHGTVRAMARGAQQRFMATRANSRVFGRPDGYKKSLDDWIPNFFEAPK